MNLDWSRWYKRAIDKSANHIYGAEKLIKEHPGRLFLDPECKHPFPFEIHDAKKAKFHRIIVAHGCQNRCRKELGGSGSLMIFPEIVGEKHYKNPEFCIPFAVGQVNPVKGFRAVSEKKGPHVSSSTSAMPNVI